MVRLAGPVLAVREKQILPAVPIVVDKGNAWTEGLRKILFTESACVVSEGEPRGFGHVRELNGGRVGLTEESEGRQHQDNSGGSAKPDFEIGRILDLKSEIRNFRPDVPRRDGPICTFGFRI